MLKEIIAFSFQRSKSKQSDRMNATNKTIQKAPAVTKEEFAIEYEETSFDPKRKLKPEEILTEKDFDPDELKRFAEECYLSVEDYLAESNCSRVRDRARERGLSVHAWIKDVAESKKRWFDNEKKKKEDAKAKTKGAGRDHSFILLDKDNKVIFEREELTKSERNALIDDFNRNGGRSFYLEGAVRFMTDLDAGITLFLQDSDDE